LLREAVSQIGDKPGNRTLLDDAQQAVAAWLRSVPVVEVSLTKQEWDAYLASLKEDRL